MKITGRQFSGKGDDGLPHKDDPSKDDSKMNENSSRENPSPGETADPDSIEEPAKPGLIRYPVVNDIYRYLYFLGIQLLRYKRRRMRGFSHKWNAFAASVREDAGHIFKNIRIGLRTGWRNLTSPLRDMRTRFRGLMEDLEHEKRYGSNVSLLKVRGRVAWFVLRRLGSVLRWLLNYAAPIAGCLLIYAMAQYYTGQTYVLRLEYNGEEIGYISDESVFTQAQNAMKGRLASDATVLPMNYLPHYELVPRDGEQLLTVDRLTDILIRSSGNEFVDADGLYIETSVGSGRMELLGAVEDGAELLRYMDTMREKYRTSEMSSDARIEFLKKVQLKPGLYPVSAVRPLGELKAELSGEERGETYYTVISGDTPLRIAAKNGISVADLQSLNPNVDVEKTLYPGDQLLVSRSVPKLGIKVMATVKYRETIPFSIKQETDPSQTVGWTNLKQEGKEGVREYTAEVVYIDGTETERNVIDRRVVREPVDQILQVGGSRPLQVVPQDSTGKLPSGAFAWPTAGGRIGPGYMGYYGHTGSDISFSGCYGTPVYASAAGPVVQVKYGTTGYGYHIIIDHGNGLQTLYGHCSELYVNIGDQVSQGQQIGAIGRTGNTTGPHLHFEVRRGGTPVDAAPYLYG